MTDANDLRRGLILFQTPHDSDWDPDSRGLWTVAPWNPGEYSNVNVKRGTVCLDGTARDAQTFSTFTEALTCLRRLRAEVE
jgi:hypothetical protein